VLPPCRPHKAEISPTGGTIEVDCPYGETMRGQYTAETLST
jgi:hypothetical protein